MSCRAAIKLWVWQCAARCPVREANRRAGLVSEPERIGLWVELLVTG